MGLAYMEMERFIEKTEEQIREPFSDELVTDLFVPYCIEDEPMIRSVFYHGAWEGLIPSSGKCKSIFGRVIGAPREVQDACYSFRDGDPTDIVVSSRSPIDGKVYKYAVHFFPTFKEKNEQFGNASEIRIVLQSGYDTEKSGNYAVFRDACLGVLVTEFVLLDIPKNFYDINHIPSHVMSKEELEEYKNTFEEYLKDLNNKKAGYGYDDDNFDDTKKL